MDYGAIFRRSADCRGCGVSTDSAPAVRRWRLSPAAPRMLPSAVTGPRRHRGPSGYCRHCAAPQVHLGYIRTLACEYASQSMPRMTRQQPSGRNPGCREALSGGRHAWCRFPFAASRHVSYAGHASRPGKRARPCRPCQGARCRRRYGTQARAFSSTWPRRPRCSSAFRWLALPLRALRRPRPIPWMCCGNAGVPAVPAAKARHRPDLIQRGLCIVHRPDAARRGAPGPRDASHGGPRLGTESHEHRCAAVDRLCERLMDLLDDELRAAAVSRDDKIRWEASAPPRRVADETLAEGAA